MCWMVQGVDRVSPGYAHRDCVNRMMVEVMVEVMESGRQGFCAR